RRSRDACSADVLSAEWRLVWRRPAAAEPDRTTVTRSNHVGLCRSGSTAVASDPYQEPTEFMDRWRSVTPRRGGRLAYRPRSDVITPAGRMTVTPEELPVISAMLFAFAPLHKRAFGAAMGVAGAMLMTLITVAGILLPGAQEFPLHLLRQYFRGYSVTWPGVVAGAAWGLGV